jgi:hypothetical protein
VVLSRRRSIIDCRCRRLSIVVCTDVRIQPELRYRDFVQPRGRLKIAAMRAIHSRVMRLAGDLVYPTRFMLNINIC